jgi:hypothetical protein
MTESVMIKIVVDEDILADAKNLALYDVHHVHLLDPSKSRRRKCSTSEYSHTYMSMKNVRTLIQQSSGSRLIRNGNPAARRRDAGHGSSCG